VGEFLKRSAFCAKLCALFICTGLECRGVAHVLPRALARLLPSGTDADVVACHVSQTAEHGDHQLPGSGVGVGTPLCEREKGVFVDPGLSVGSIHSGWKLRRSRASSTKDWPTA
jgi:hypothetical protein